ncbi:protein MMS22-like [Oscarella lobularis]|uniref:protein MMS22-like n=1 Tax=Oscarella lobularis TaxID=121494 RepID=UPI003313719A
MRIVFPTKQTASTHFSYEKVYLLPTLVNLPILIRSVTVRKCEATSSILENFLRTGGLHRLLSGVEPELSAPRGAAVLFGASFCSENTAQHADRLFSLLRQNINRLTGQTASDDEAQIIGECEEFLEFMKSRIFRSGLESSTTCLCYKDNVSTRDLLTRNLKILLRHAGRLSDTSLSSMKDPTTLKSTPVFRFKLLIRWTVVEVLSRQETEGYCDDSSSVNAEVISLVEDLLLCAKKLKNEEMFSCLDMKLLWVALLRLTQWRSERESSPSFWSLSSSLLTKLFLNAEMNENTIEFCWFALYQLSLLFSFDVYGRDRSVENATLDSNWVFVEELIKHSFVSSDVKMSENFSRKCLCHLYALCQLWSIGLDAITSIWGPLWEIYSKRLNERFTMLNQSTDSYRIASSLEELVTDVKDVCNLKQASTALRFTSFQWFLRIALCLLSTSNSSVQKQLKSRIYSRFHRRRMQDLTEIGLTNFLTMFLALSCMAEASDAGGKMTQLLELLSTEKNLNVGKQRRVFWGYFALMSLTSNDRDICNDVVKSSCALFDNWCNLFMSHGLLSTPLLMLCLSTPLLMFSLLFMSRMYRSYNGKAKEAKEIWFLIAEYLEQVKCLVSKSETPLRGCEHLLLGSGLSVLLSSSKENELLVTLSCLNAVTSCFRKRKNKYSATEKTSKEFAGSLWNHVLPCLKTKARHQHLSSTVKVALASLCAEMFFLSNSINFSLDQGLRRLADDFILAADLSYSFLIPLLERLLSDRVATKKLCELHNFQTQLISIWIRCFLTFVLDGSSKNVATKTMLQNSLEDISDQILKIEQVRDVAEKQFRERADDIYASFPAERCLHSFIMTLGDLHFTEMEASATNADNIKERLLSYLGDITKHLDAVLLSSAPLPEAIRMVCVFCGILVKYCSRMLYSSHDHRCLLPRLLDRVFPQRKKVISPALSTWQRRTVCLFLQGLSCLPPDHTGFVKRKYKELFQQFLLAHLQDRTASDLTSGFEELLTVKCPVGSSQQLRDSRRLSMEIITDRFLVLPKHPNELVLILNFLKSTFAATSSGGQIASDASLLLPVTLACLLACERWSSSSLPQRMQQLVIDVLTVMLKACRQNTAILSTSQLLTLFRTYLTSNLETSQALAFKPLYAVANVDKELCSLLLPDIERGISEIEHRRGTGSDRGLRAALEDFRRMVRLRSENY